jgi:epoxyqueuosine reductase QueG
MEELSRTVIDYVMCEGACATGIASLETLRGGPPSSDITFVLPEAKSAVTFAVPLDESLIPQYLMKKDRLSHERNNLITNSIASGIALHLAKFLQKKGYRSVPVAANYFYREDTLHAEGEEIFPGGSRDMSPEGELNRFPDVSHRYLAVRSGVGHFGLSGNVITKNEGAAVILGSTVTSAELIPTDPLPEEQNYCDGCRQCMASCASEMMDSEKTTRVKLGDLQFTYSKRRDYLRCIFVCGGFAGLHSSGKWSTWSPGRFSIPENDSDWVSAMLHGAKAFSQRPDSDGGLHFDLAPKKVYLTCGNCQLVCCPDKEERKRRHKMLVESGVIVQNPDGSHEALAPEAAIERIASMSPERRALYEDS